MYYITEYMLSKTNRLQISPEITPGNHGFSMFNDAGTEVEVSEFLYSLTRMIKPNFVLETGTHIGISSSFIGQALKDNEKGKLVTLEIELSHLTNARHLWDKIGIEAYVSGYLSRSLEYEIGDQEIDFLFLDSEPQLRFDEFLRFWPHLRQGGFIAIHDLHPHLGFTKETIHGIFCWPYGDFREKIGPYILSKDVQIFSFPTPRGLTFFQKRKDSHVFGEYIRGDLELKNYIPENLIELGYKEDDNKP